LNVFSAEVDLKLPQKQNVVTTSAASILLNEKIANAMRDILRHSRDLTNTGRKKNERVGIEQFWILRFLYDSGPKRIKDIAEEIGITPSPVTISVKKLAASRLVTRERGKLDERVVTVRLTDEGRRFFETWRADRNQALSSLFDLLEDQEREELNKLLQKVLSAHVKTEQGEARSNLAGSELEPVIHSGGKRRAR
jgi:DNA-binding MarR family transcriptional regulator